MNRASCTFLLALTCLLVGCVHSGSKSESAGAGSDSGAFPYEVERFALENGLTALLVPMPSDGLISYWSIVRTGARDEVEKGVTGFAHFFEHMMFRGSEKYPGAVYDNIVASMGADANAYTTDDYTAYHLSITREDLPTAINIESDRFQNLAYSEEDFRTEAGAVYGEFRKSKTSPFFTLSEAVMNAAFDEHTYKHTTIGFEEDIKSMPEKFAYSKSFFERFYRPENVVLFVTGDFDVDEAKKLIRTAYEDWKPGYQEPAVPVEPEQTAPRRIEVPFDGKTLPIVSLNFKGDRLRADDPIMIAATLIEDLAFGETSAVYKKLVLEEQRVQFVGADFGYNRDPKIWDIYSMVKDIADVPAVERELWSTVEALKTELVDAERLDAVRSNIKYSFLSYLSTPDRVSNSMARFIALTGDVRVVDEIFATYDRITPEHVREAARKYLTRERSTVAILHAKDQPLPEEDSPPTGKATVAEKVESAPLPDSQVVDLQEPADPNVVYKLWFPVGSQNDPKGKEGLAALTATLLAEGSTERNSYDAILEKLFPLSASYGASVDKEMTVITGVVHRDLADRYDELFLDAVVRPGFDESDFNRLKSRAIERLTKTLRFSSDEELGKAVLYETVFDGTPYRHLELGTVAGLKSIELEDVKAFYAQHYTASSVVVGLGGSYDGKLRASLLQDLARLPEGASGTVAPPQAKTIDGRQVVLVKKPGQSTAISFGYPIDLHRGSREFYALWLANSWLGEHRNSVSHLYQVIREARGMNYGDYSYIEVFKNGGRRSMPPTGTGRRQQLFEVWIRPVPEDRALFALRAGIREVDKLAADGLTLEQFDKQRAFLKKYVAHFATTTEERLGYAIDDRFYGLDKSHLAEFRKVMESLTLDEVNAAIKKHISTENMVIAMITENPEKMAEAIQSGEATPIDYGTVPKPESILTEDKTIEAYPLNVDKDAIRIIPVESVFEE